MRAYEMHIMDWSSDRCSSDLRSMPIYLRPYRLFSPQTPYDSVALPVSSAASVTFSLCLPLNLSWLATLSREQPITTAPSLSNFALAALNSMASLVQPDVSSFG